MALTALMWHLPRGTKILQNISLKSIFYLFWEIYSSERKIVTICQGQAEELQGSQWVTLMLTLASMYCSLLCMYLHWTYLWPLGPNELVVIWCVCPGLTLGDPQGLRELVFCAFGHVGRLDPTTGTSLVRGSVRDSRPCTALCPHNSIGAMQLYCCMAMAHL